MTESPGAQWKLEDSSIPAKSSGKSNYKLKIGLPTKLPLRNKNKIKTFINK